MKQVKTTQKEQGGKKKMCSVDIKEKNGLRYGTYTVFDSVERIPKQGVTTTNLNHLPRIGRTDIHYDVGVLGVLAFYETFKNYKKLEKDKNFLERESKNLSEHVEGSYKYILFLPEINKSTRFSNIHNLKIVEIQKKAKTLFTTLFVTNDTDVAEIKKIMTDNSDCKFTLVLDMDLPFLKFKEAYTLALKNKPFVGFIARGLDKYNKMNYNYISDRSDDQIVRFISNVKAKVKGEHPCRSFPLWIKGFDYTLFATRIGPFSPSKMIKAFDIETLRYKDIMKLGKCECNIDKGEKPIEIAQKYPKDIRYIPSSVHDILMINKKLDAYIEELIKGKDVKKEIEVLILARKP